MDSTHKHRKGFREDQVVLSEAYTSIYNEEIGGDFKLSGQFHPSQEQGIKKHIMNLVNYVTDNNIKVVSYTDRPTQTALADAMAKVAPTMVSWFRTEYGLSNLARDVLSAMGNAEDYEMMENEEGELSDDWMKQDYESREDRPDGEHHDKFTSIAQDGLQQMLDQLHVGGHGEDMDMNELRLGYEQLSRGLHGLLGEFDAGEILGGAAQAQAEAGSEPEQFTPMEFPSDEEY